MKLTKNSTKNVCVERGLFSIENDKVCKLTAKDSYSYRNLTWYRLPKNYLSEDVM